MSGRVSTGGKKKGQKYQNKEAFRHNKASKKTAKILAMPISNVCQHCKDILEWRKQYRKYKPLTQPKKCLKCQQKTVKQAYHTICVPCAKSLGVCAKCNKQPPLKDEEKQDDIQQQQPSLGHLTERQRRTLLRKQNDQINLSKGKGEDEDDSDMTEDDSDMTDDDSDITDDDVSEEEEEEQI